MKVPVWLAFGLLFNMLMLTGCSAVYYEHRAVERARAYLLKNAPELSTTQRAYVRYNDPLLLQEGIFGGNDSTKSDMSQICVTWLIPGQKDAYLVFGASDTRMQSWYPNRLIRKTFQYHTQPLLLAADTARKYALNGLYYDLSKHEYNCVRFEIPKAFRTRFELPTSVEKDENPKLQEARKKLKQFSIVWSPSDQENKVVIYGLATPQLGNFTVMGGGVMSPDYFSKHMIEELSFSGGKPAAAPGKQVQ